MHSAESFFGRTLEDGTLLQARNHSVENRIILLAISFQDLDPSFGWADFDNSKT